MEYVFSPAGQNTWLKGFAAPVLLPAMVKNGTADAAALAAMGSPAQPPVQYTVDQTKKATDYLTQNWKFITIKYPRPTDNGGPEWLTLGSSDPRHPIGWPPAPPLAGPAPAAPPGSGTTSPWSRSMPTSGCS